MTLLWAAIVLLILAKARLGGFQRAGAWFALAFFGQACSLSLYHAGPVVSYHHYRLHGLGSGQVVALAGGILVQVVLVAWGLRAHGAPLRSWLREHLPGWRLLALLAALLVASAKISRPPEVSAVEFVFATLVELATLGNLALAVSALPADVLARFDGFLDRILGPEKIAGEPDPGGLDGFAFGAAAFALVAAALLCVVSYQRHPHVPDEVVYLIHARYLAAGLLAMPAPPVPAGFDIDLMLLAGDRWFCPVPPGWPAVLAVGAFFGAPWLVNPVLGALTVLATYLLARELTDRRSARWTIALLAASPWFTFTNMSFMPHTWALLCCVVAALGVARARRTGVVTWALLAGVAAGLVSLVRPLEGLVLALALGAWSIGFGGARVKLSGIAALITGTVAVGALAFPYNRHFTGDPLQFPINEYIDRTYGEGRNAIGFGPDRGLGWSGLDPYPGHSPFEAVLNTQFNAFAVDAELFGWGTGSLFLVLFLLFGGRLYRKDRALLVFTAAIVVANSFYYFAGGPDFGARYWYPILVPLVMLSVSGLRALEGRTPRPVLVRASVYVLVAFAWLAWVPWRAVDKYYHYRGMHPGVRELAAQHEFGRSLVLVTGLRHPDFASAAVYNPIDLEADGPIFAWDTARAELVEHYADRPVWLVGPGGVLLDGPVAAADVELGSATALRTP